MDGTTRLLGIGWRQIKLAADTHGRGTPEMLPRSQGLEQAVRQGVRDELDRRGGGGGGTGDLERRVGNLETDVRAIKENVHGIAKEVAVIGSNYVTKSDLAALTNEIHKIHADLGKEIHKTQADLIKWVVGTLIAGMGVSAAIVFGVMRLAPAQSPANQNQSFAPQAQAPAQQQAQPSPPAASGTRKTP